jgi:endo-1,4-beta-xylanase
MVIIGHTLVWHSQTPQWVFEDDSGKPVDRDTLLKRMHAHISTVVGRYKGRIKGWDVVNEALNEDGTLRDSKWKQIIGDDYILKAYQFAHEADPDLQLYYNDYSLENKPKRNGAVALIQKLQSQGVKIAAVGMQGHYGMNWPSGQQIQETISAFAKLGIKVSITELDVSVLPSVIGSQSADVSINLALQAKLNPYTNGLPSSVQKQLAERYACILGAVLKEREHVQRVTFWGVTDGDSWLNDWPMRGRTDYPLLFDRNYQPKPVFDAVVRCVQAAEQAPAQGGQNSRSN